MRRSPYTATSCRCGPGYRLGLGLLLALLGAGVVHGQVVAQPEYQAHALKHKAAADVEKMLREVLSTADLAVDVIADPRANRVLIRGPQAVQQAARQLIEAIDRPSGPPGAARTIVRTYRCAPGRQAELAGRLRAIYASHGEFRVAADPQAPQLLVVAPPRVHDDLARRSATLGIQAASEAAPGQPPSEAADQHYVRLMNFRPEQIERMFRDLFGPRLEALTDRRPGQADYVFVGSAGERITLGIDRRQNGVMVTGPQPTAGQFVRLIQTLDGPRSPSGSKTRVVPIRKADPAKVRQAIEAYRSGFRAGSRQPTRPSPSDGSYLPRGRDTRFPDGRIDLVNYLFQTKGEGTNGDANGPLDVEPVPTGDQLEDQRRRERLLELGSDVEIEALPNLDVIILRGRDRDVDEISRIIEEIERLSAETEPAIEVVPLRHVQGPALSEIIEQINRELLVGRQGRVSVTPLVKPNALLLVGWGEAVKAIKQLIQKLDRPVPPESQLRIFALRHAAALQIASTVESFLAGRGGLGPAVQVIADPRTNSLIVQAAPRDMKEVELMIERLDRDDSEAVMRTQIFKLENSLAVDLGGILQQAIASAAGGTAAHKSAVLELLTVDAEGERLLKSGLLGDVQVTPNPRTNTLVVTAPAESMDLIAALIKQLDMPSAVAQIKVFRVVNSDATDMVTMLRTLLPSQTGASTRPQLAGAEGETSLVPVRFSVDPRTNSIIATGSEGDLVIVEALLLRLDEEDIQQRETTVYRLRNAPAVDVANAISLFLRSERQVEMAGPGAVSPFQRIEREVVVVPEVVSNSLILSATPRFFKEIMELIEQLDAEPPQVMIQVLIAEVALGEMDEFGIELGLQDSVLFDRSLLGDIVTTVQSSSTPGTGVVVSNEVIQSASNTPGFNFNDPTNSTLGNSGSSQSLVDAAVVGGQTLSNFAVGRVNSELGFGGLVLSASSESVSVLLRALQECRRLKVLSRPQIMTVDNQPAYIQVGKRVPRITSSTLTDVGLVNSIALENVGLILGVTPRISPDGMVVMEIDAEKSDLGPIQEGIPVSISEGQVIRSPSIELTMAQTTVSVADGETVVLGGLITKRTSTTKRRVPWLADIPLLGNLFRYDSNSEKRTELLIILTPHIILSPDDAEKIKQVEASRMHWCLGDVHEIHGPTGLWEMGGPEAGMPAPEVIYPDLNPRGIPPEQQVPTPAEPPNQTGPILPNNQQAQGPAMPIGPPPPYPSMYDPAVRQARRNPSNRPPIQPGGAVLR